MAVRWVLGDRRMREHEARPVSTHRDWPFQCGLAGRLSALFVLVWAGMSGCAGAPANFGPTRAVARTRASELLTGLQQRFTNVDRSPAAAAAVARIDRGVFTPAQVFEDSATWNVLQADSVRAMMVAGHFARDRFVVAKVGDAPQPRDLAASRDEIRLARVARDQYEWSTSVDQMLGAVKPNDIGRVVNAMLAAPAVIGDGDLHAETVAAFPRSSEVLGQLFSLDSVQRTSRNDGTVLVSLVMHTHPDWLAARYPAFASYLRTYLNPMRLRSIVRDAAGGEWFDLDFASNRLALRFRADRDGHLAPIDGAPRSMPDSVSLVSDFRTKVWLFSVGVTGLASDVVITQTGQMLSAHMRFRQEPRWHLPLAVAHFVKGSLHRPFEGDGAQYRVAVTDVGNDRTLLQRDGDVTVQESMIMRWFGGLGARALGEFAGAAETQENAYFASIFAALRDDVDSALGGPATVAGEVDAGGKRP
jgi:hypothetical protein